MCGIAGIHYFNKVKRVAEEELRPLIHALRHRGPDGLGFLIDGNMGLAHCRLAIADIGDGGKQPLSNEDTSIQLVCNGEIYNFKELKKQLEKRGHQFKTRNDNEVIVHLYEEKGLEFIQKINGMFAFALWDKRRRRLILGRDHLGIKPLYYYKKDKELIFASEVKGILAHPEFKKELNYDFFRFYFFHNSIPAPHTPFKNILSLSPASLLIFDKNGLEKQIQYWHPIFRINKDISEREASNEFLRLLQDSIRHHFPSEVDVGIAMSGGIDSNILLALTARLSKKPVKVFSCSFTDDTPDKKNEISIAQNLAKYFNADFRLFSLSPRELPEKIDRIVEALDMPICTFAIDYYLTEKINREVKVLFTGDGTEELLGKYWHHRLAQSMAHILEYCQLNPNNTGVEHYFLKKYCEILPQRAFQFSSVHNFLESEGRNLFQKNIASLLKTPESISSFIFKNYFNRETKDFINKILEADLLHFLPNHSLNVIDKLSMANAVEIRVPYLDHQLVEYVAKIPVRFKMRGGVTKYLLRQLAEQILPKKLDLASRGGVTGPPLRRWLTFHLENYVKSVLSPSRLKKSGFINPHFVRKLISEHYQLKKYPQYFRSDNVDTMPNDQTIKLWKLILFQIWWEKYML